MYFILHTLYLVQARGVQLCFVNSHLAAHQDRTLQRNQDMRAILKQMRLGSTHVDVAAQFNTVWFGDLNYRIDRFTHEEVPRQTPGAARCSVTLLAARRRGPAMAWILVRGRGNRRLAVIELDPSRRMRVWGLTAAFGRQVVPRVEKQQFTELIAEDQLRKVK